MGASQSTQATTMESNTASKNSEEYVESSVSESKAYNGTTKLVVEDDASTSEEEEEEEDEEWSERLAVLEDARKLRQVAEFFLCPEKPVQVDPTSFASCYFTRPSVAPAIAEDEVEEEERNAILEEMKQLKKLAVDYLHPELPVQTTDPYACGRNYFSRPSAEQYYDEGDMIERDNILKAMKELKKHAVDYMCPELPMKTTDPLAYGRNFFMRPSSPKQDSLEEAEERAEILADTQALKQLAVDFLHPELPCVTTDPCATSRNYFTRPSAPKQETEDEANERAQILEDALELKKLAVDYLHPEQPCVTTDPYATGRNYFARPSAEGIEEEGEHVLSEMSRLKKLAQDYFEPTRSVEVDPLASCRNYFDRPSAVVQEEMIHSYCEYVDHGYHHIIDHDHHYYWYNNDEVSEHFEMEYDDTVEETEDIQYEFKDVTHEVDPFHIVGQSPYIERNTSTKTPAENDNLLACSPPSVLLLTWTPAAE